MEQKVQRIIDYFDIPKELAKELSDLLSLQKIKDRLMIQLIDEPEKYEKVELSSIPITGKIEAIKIKITKEFLPEKYKGTNYLWNYDGYDVDENRVQIIEETALTEKSN